MTLPADLDLARLLHRIDRRFDKVEKTLVQLANSATVLHRATSVTLPALAAGANTVTAEWNAPLPSNQYVAVACYAGNSAFPDLSGVTIAVMPDTQTPTTVAIRVTAAAAVGAGRKVNVIAVHGGA